MKTITTQAAQEHKRQIAAMRNSAQRFKELGMIAAYHMTMQQVSAWEAWLIKQNDGVWP